VLLLIVLTLQCCSLCAYCINSLNIFTFIDVVLNEEQSQFLNELVGPCSKFFEVSLMHLHFYFRINNCLLYTDFLKYLKTVILHIIEISNNGQM